MVMGMDHVTEAIADGLWYLCLKVLDLSHFISNGPWLTYAIIAVASILVKGLHSENDKETIHIDLPDAAQPGWKGAELEEPDIKVYINPIPGNSVSKAQALGAWLKWDSVL